MHNIIMGSKYIDHIGGFETRNDNRRNNLRIPKGIYSFETYNNMNKKIQKNNKTGCTGVTWHKRDQIWESYISIDNERIYLGRFKNFNDAVNSRKQAEEELFKDYSRSNSIKLFNINNKKGVADGVMEKE